MARLLYGNVPLYINRIIQRAIDEGMDLSEKVSHVINFNEDEQKIIKSAFEGGKLLHVIFEKNNKTNITNDDSYTSALLYSYDQVKNDYFLNTQLSTYAIKTGTTPISLMINWVTFQLSGTFKVE